LLLEKSEVTDFMPFEQHNGRMGTPVSRRTLVGFFAAIFVAACNAGKAKTAVDVEPPKRLPRLDFAQSIERLRKLGLVSPDQHPRMPSRMPQYDDETIEGLSIFRSGNDASGDMSNLTIPRTYVGRSELDVVAIRNTDLSESNLCWNDFVKCDFELAIIDRADMRASNFVECNFAFASLLNVDMRHSSFSNCRFTNADVSGAIIAKEQLKELGLSAKQLASVVLRQEAGPEPNGG
jgi:BTB/POZ domain-containing protein KCTD9